MSIVQPVIVSNAADDTQAKKIKARVYKQTFDHSTYVTSMSDLSEKPIVIGQSKKMSPNSKKYKSIRDQLEQIYSTMEAKTPFQIDDKKKFEQNQLNLLSANVDSSSKVTYYDLYNKILYNGSENDGKEDDERSFNHPKTGVVMIQFANTCVTHHYMKKKFEQQPELLDFYKRNHVFTKSFLDVVAGFYFGIDENGFADYDSSHFINVCDNTILDSDEEIFDFKFKFIIERYSSASAKERFLKEEQHKQVTSAIDNYFKTFSSFPTAQVHKALKKVEKKGEKATFKPCKHTVSIQPVIDPRTIKSVNDLRRLIVDSYNNQGIKFVRDDSLLLYSNCEHGCGHPVVFEIRDVKIENNKLIRLATSKGYKMVYCLDKKTGKSLKFEKGKTYSNYKEIETTEGRHYGGDVEHSFNGQTMTFGKGIKFDNLFTSATDLSIKRKNKKTKAVSAPVSTSVSASASPADTPVVSESTSEED